MKYLEKIVIHILHKITKDPKDHIEWELHSAKLHDEDWSLDETSGDQWMYPQGTGYSLLNFMRGYLDWNARIDQGWVPPDLR